jgi:hypothetical protein
MRQMMQHHISEEQNPQVKEISYFSQGITEADILSVLLNFTGIGVQRRICW